MESKIAFDMVKSLGGSPTPISFGELYTSLQQGVVDGAENNLPSFYLSRHYEVCKFYTMDEHTILPDVLLISTHSWNTFSELEKKWFNESVSLSVIEQRRLWSESEKESLKAITDFGVEIIKPSKELFQKKTNQIIEAFKGDTLVYKLIKRIRKTD
jgi:TRAP-type C4-dicarboxylate transport system substrate-binding protein